MIQNDLEFEAMQERIQLFENVLAEARRNYSPSSYQAMSKAFLADIARMQEEIRVYLSCAEEQLKAA
jgi:hypothetical protein